MTLVGNGNGNGQKFGLWEMEMNGNGKEKMPFISTFFTTKGSPLMSNLTSRQQGALVPQLGLGRVPVQEQGGSGRSRHRRVAALLQLLG